MKLFIGINFILLATIMAGLYAIAQANYGRLGASSRYWSIAIVCDAVGLALLGGFFIAIPDFTQSNRIGTVANSDATVFSTAPQGQGALPGWPVPQHLTSHS